MSSTSQPALRTAGEVLKDLRRLLAPPGEAFLSQKRLAKALNLSEGYLQKIEAGGRDILLHHVKELALLRPEEEAAAQQFELLLNELRAIALAAVQNKLGIALAAADREDEEDADALKAQLDAVEAKLDAVQNEVDTSATRIETKIAASETRTEVQLSAIWGSAQRTESKLDSARAKQNRIEREIIAAIWSAASLGAVVCVIVGLAMTLILVSVLRPRSGNDSGARLAEHESGERDQEEESLSGGLDGGTELAKLVKQALPMPKSALPGQMTAPCPDDVDEFNGLCWGKVSLTPAQYQKGACDSLQLYEPSEGWCRANHAGYQPWLGTKKKNNAVEPQ